MKLGFQAHEHSQFSTLRLPFSAFLLSLFAAVSTTNVASASTPPTTELRLAADAKAPGTELVHFWSLCVGAGRANEGLRASWLEQLKQAHDACGFQYLRFHGLFHDDMFVYLKKRDGGAQYNWQYVDDLFDRMLAIGVRPFVELGFFPGEMAGGPRTQFWWKGRVTPPEDLRPWAQLVAAFVEHCRARYGAEEVRRWYFEVWNEPDLDAFWDSSRSKYFELYQVSVKAIKAIDPKLRVGGPATSNFVADGRFDGERQDKTKAIPLHTPEESEKLTWTPVWVKEFLAFCAAHQLPVDFVSTHPYPTDWALDASGKHVGLTRQVEATPNDLKRLHELVAASAYPKAAIHLTEWSSTPSARDFAHDSLPAATYVVKANLESAGLADSLSYWTFTDVFEEGGAGNTIFHGGFGLINYQGIVKPTFHAYRFLHALGDEVLAKATGEIITRHRATGRVTALAYHYPPEMKITVPGGSREIAEKTEATGGPAEIVIELSGLKPNARFAVEVLDKHHANAVAAWKAIGAPESPTREQTAALRKAAMDTARDEVHADANGNLSFKRAVDAWSVVLLDEQETP